jgi:hypothetical protein
MGYSSKSINTYLSPKHIFSNSKPFTINGEISENARKIKSRTNKNTHYILEGS